MWFSIFLEWNEWLEFAMQICIGWKCITSNIHFDSNFVGVAPHHFSIYDAPVYRFALISHIHRFTTAQRTLPFESIVFLICNFPAPRPHVWKSAFCNSRKNKIETKKKSKRNKHNSHPSIRRRHICHAGTVHKAMNMCGSFANNFWNNLNTKSLIVNFPWIDENR